MPTYSSSSSHKHMNKSIPKNTLSAGLGVKKFKYRQQKDLQKRLHILAVDLQVHLVHTKNHYYQLYYQQRVDLAEKHLECHLKLALLIGQRQNLEPQAVAEQRQAASGRLKHRVDLQEVVLQERLHNLPNRINSFKHNHEIFSSPNNKNWSDKLKILSNRNADIWKEQGIQWYHCYVVKIKLKGSAII